MKLYTTTTFKGHYPVGTAAVVWANNPIEARRLLNAELKNRGLEDPEYRLDEWDFRSPQAIILNDGDY